MPRERDDIDELLEPTQEEIERIPREGIDTLRHSCRMLVLQQRKLYQKLAEVEDNAREYQRTIRALTVVAKEIRSTVALLQELTGATGAPPVIHFAPLDQPIQLRRDSEGRIVRGDDASRS